MANGTGLHGVEIARADADFARGDARLRSVVWSSGSHKFIFYTIAETAIR